MTETTIRMVGNLFADEPGFDSTALGTARISNATDACNYMFVHHTDENGTHYCPTGFMQCENEQHIADDLPCAWGVITTDEWPSCTPEPKENTRE